MNQEIDNSTVEKQKSKHRIARLGAGALLVFSMLASTGCAVNQPEFSESTHEYVVPNGGTPWEAADTIEGIEKIDDKHQAIDYIEEMPQNTEEGGALHDGKLNPGEHLVVPDSVER